MLYLYHQRRAGAYRVGRKRRPHFLLKSRKRPIPSLLKTPLIVNDARTNVQINTVQPSGKHLLSNTSRLIFAVYLRHSYSAVKCLQATRYSAVYRWDDAPTWQHLEIKKSIYCSAHKRKTKHTPRHLRHPELQPNFINKKLSCRRQSARCFVSLSTSLCHSLTSLEITPLSRAYVSPY